ncbi:hypothetical protein BH10ACT3_BH10ACT3_19250 [soil metagenome]
MVAAAYEHGRALNTAMIGEVDDVIDPADSRRWVTILLTPPGRDDRVPHGPGTPKKRPNIDTW